MSDGNFCYAEPMDWIAYSKLETVMAYQGIRTVEPVYTVHDFARSILGPSPIPPSDTELSKIWSMFIASLGITKSPMSGAEISDIPAGLSEEQQIVWRKYLDQLKHSEGFDVTDFPDSGIFSGIFLSPFDFKGHPKRYEVANDMANFAINGYNVIVNHSAHFEVVEIVRVNAEGGGRWPVVLITFQAQDKFAVEGALPKTFRAKVMDTKNSRADRYDLLFIKMM